MLFVNQPYQRVDTFSCDPFGVAILVMDQDAKQVHEFFLAADVGKKDETDEHLREVNELHVVLFGKVLIEFGEFVLKGLVFLLTE